MVFFSLAFVCFRSLFSCILWLMFRKYHSIWEGIDEYGSPGRKRIKWNLITQWAHKKRINKEYDSKANETTQRLTSSFMDLHRAVPPLSFGNLYAFWWVFCWNNINGRRALTHTLTHATITSRKCELQGRDRMTANGMTTSYNPYR